MKSVIDHLNRCLTSTKTGEKAYVGDVISYFNDTNQYLIIDIDDEYVKLSLTRIQITYQYPHEDLSLAFKVVR